MPCYAALALGSDSTAAVVAATAPPILSDSLGSSQILNPRKVPASTAGNICEGRGKTRAAFDQSLSNPRSRICLDEIRTKSLLLLLKRFGSLQLFTELLESLSQVGCSFKEGTGARG